ncbi:hypothetical protein K9M79_03535 [Candidatus Woesearchaeota archaeon]|nr:hypothetical protein [Candidatus Woesearchaeota archaeon]
MIDKIKGILGLQKQIEELEKSFSENRVQAEKLTSEISDLKEQIIGLRSEVVQNKKAQDQYSDDLKKMDKDVDGVVKRVNDSVNNLNLVARQMPKDIFTQLRDELRESIKKVKIELDSYNTLKDEMNNIKINIKEFNTEISKFKSISSGIKAADFELVRHQKNLESNDREKLALMKKIDTLERLISKMRRRNN